jgi:predicted transcriptional regulator of viral defense system
VLKALGNASEGLSSTEIWGAAGFTTLNATNVALSRMASDGVIERVKRGVYGLPGTRAKNRLAENM